ncbi:MAG TPA: hypothetical protein DF712_01665, partial [Balneola sp.]|nr:hypothetical protein [Balneola sp.]
GFKTWATSKKTYFVGADTDAGTYSYPDLVADGRRKRLMEVPIDPTDVGGKGIAKFATDGGGGQLGKGSPFASWTKDVNITKQIKGDIFTPFGYDKDNKYGGASGYNPGTQESRLEKRYTENTPIDGIYGQFNLKDEAHNSGFIKQPFVTRGIQRAGVYKNQRWGLGNFFEGVDSNTSLPAGVQAAMDVVQSLDSGFMRGGMSTSIHRSIFDAYRLGQYMLTPDGLTFLAKQVGLQASNPKVETPIEPSPFNRRTRVYNLGLNTLASAAGNAFGLHFKRHGIVPVGERRWYYENVVKQRNEFPSTPSALADVALGKKNRLLLLRDEISMPKTVPGLPYLTLSGLAGPKSVYGIGGTAIRRYENTNDKDALAKIGVDAKSEYGPLREKEVLPAGPAALSEFSLTAPQVPSLKDKSRYIDEPLKNGDTSSPTKKSTGGQNLEDLEEQGLKGKLETSVKNDKLPNSEQNNKGEGGIGKLHKASEIQEINGGNYAVTPYDKIPKNLAKNSFNDFRQTILKQQDTKDSKFIGNNDKTKTQYNQKNLENFFGFGKPGDPSRDRRDYTISNPDHDKVNAYDFQKLSLDAVINEGPNDLVKFWFAGSDFG